MIGTEEVGILEFRLGVWNLSISFKLKKKKPPYVPNEVRSEPQSVQDAGNSSLGGG